MVRRRDAPAVARSEERMEIRDWLRASGDRVRLLVVIPLAAALIALLIGIIAPTKYHSTATVFLPGVNTDGPSTTETAQRVANFIAALKSPAVREAIASETGADPSSLDGVTAERTGQSGVVLVGFAGAEPDVVPTVAEAFVRGALRIEAQSNLDRAKAQVEAYQRLLDDADSDYQRFIQDEIFYTDELLTTLSERYTRETDLLNGLLASGAPQSEIDEQQADVDQLRDRIASLQEARDAFNRKRSAEFLLTDALDQSVEAEGDLAAAETLQIPTTQATARSKLTDVAQKVLFAGVFAFLLAAGLLVLLVLLEGRRPGAGGSAEEPAPAPFQPRSAAGRS
jgi:hypothetical protein